MVLTEAKQNLIRQRILAGCTIRSIAQEVGVSERTVCNYKKKIPVKRIPENDSGDNTIIWDNTKQLTNLEKKYTTKIEREIALYEDIEEGWIYHITSQDYRLKTSGLWWCGIVYPDSAPEGWELKIRDMGFRLAISPLHDKDTWNHDSPEMVDPSTGKIIPKGARYKAGDRKKAHWHIIIVCDQRVSAVDINNTIRAVTNGPYLQKCRSLRNAHDYFWHINAPEKYQRYDKNEARYFNNFHLEPNKYEIGLLQNDIFETIKEHNFINMVDLIDHYIGQPEYITILTAKPGLFTSYINGRWKKAHPEGRVQRVLLVTEKDLI